MPCPLFIQHLVKVFEALLCPETVPDKLWERESARGPFPSRSLQSGTGSQPIASPVVTTKAETLKWMPVHAWAWLCLGLGGGGTRPGEKVGRALQGKGDPDRCVCWEALGLGVWGSVAGTEATRALAAALYLGVWT